MRSKASQHSLDQLANTFRWTAVRPAGLFLHDAPTTEALCLMSTLGGVPVPWTRVRASGSGHAVHGSNDQPVQHSLDQPANTFRWTAVRPAGVSLHDASTICPSGVQGADSWQAQPSTGMARQEGAGGRVPVSGQPAFSEAL